MRKVGCFGLILGLGAVVALFLVVKGWGGAGPAPRTLTVQIGEGSTLAGAATELEKAGAIPSARRFRLYARVFGSGDPIKAGEYRIAPRTSQSDILKLMQGGKVVQRLVGAAVAPRHAAGQREQARDELLARHLIAVAVVADEQTPVLLRPAQTGRFGVRQRCSLTVGGVWGGAGFQVSPVRPWAGGHRGHF